MDQHPVFSVKDARRFLHARGIQGKRTQHRLIETHLRREELARLNRGTYVSLRCAAWNEAPSIDPYLLASRMSFDAVLGYRTALEVQGLLPRYGHAPFTYITGTPSRDPLTTWQGITLRAIGQPRGVRRSDPGIGTVTMERYGHRLRATSLERTIVDLLHRPRILGSWMAIVRLLPRLPEPDAAGLLTYITLLDNATTAAKLGWVLEAYRDRWPLGDQILRSLELLRPRGPHYLNRSTRDGGLFLSRWNLVVPQHLSQELELCAGAPVSRDASDMVTGTPPRSAR